MARIPDLNKLIDLRVGFEDIAKSSIGTSTSGISLAVDLNTRVRSSDLECRERLSAQLDSVVTQARKTGSKLQKFGRKFEEVANRIRSLEDALRSLENADSQKLAFTDPAEKFSITKCLSSIWTSVKRLFFPFWSNPASVVQEPNENEKTITASNEALAQILALIKQLILEAEVLAFELDRLEMMLHTVYETVVKERKNMLSKTRTVMDRLYEFWLWLIGRSRAAAYKLHQTLLDSVMRYRKDALNSVVPTANLLRRVSANLDNLRGRLAVEPPNSDHGEI